MKSYYQQPLVEVTSLSADHSIMLTASGESNTMLTDGGSTSEAGVGQAGTRRFSVWDEEDSEW